MRNEPYTGPFPRPRHSHRCENCWESRRQGAVYCYKQNCKRAQRIESCEVCGRQVRPADPAPVVESAAPAEDPWAAARRLAQLSLF
jgi:hypothetical protein